VREMRVAVAQRGPMSRDFQLLWLGATVSQAGTAVTMVALPLIALQTLRASVLQVGALVTLGEVAWPLVGLPAGVLADRWARRRVAVVCDLARMGLIGTVPVATALGHLTLVHLYLVALLVGGFTVFFEVSSQALLPEVVGPEGLSNANARLYASQATAQMAGPPLGGVLVQWLTAPFALVVDTVSYAVSAACLGRLRAPARRHAGRRAPALHELRDGLRAVFAAPTLRALTLCSAHANLFLGMLQAVIVVFLVRTLGMSASGVGVVLGVGSFGALLGAAVSPHLERTLGVRATLGVVFPASVAMGLLVPLAHLRGAALVAIGYLGMNLGVVVFSVVGATLRQRVCPPELMGRMVASTRVLSWGSLPVGGVLGGALGQAAGPRTALWVATGGLLSSSAWLLGVRAPRVG
jgi:predicted MFS family arabinose efflux permease